MRFIPIFIGFDPSRLAGCCSFTACPSKNAIAKPDSLQSVPVREHIRLLRSFFAPKACSRHDFGSRISTLRKTKARHISGRRNTRRAVQSVLANPIEKKSKPLQRGALPKPEARMFRIAFEQPRVVLKQQVQPETSETIAVEHCPEM